MPTTSKAEPSWYFDAALKLKVYHEQQSQGYALISAASEDFKKVLNFYEHHPVPGYDIKSVEIIYNPAMNRGFDLNMSLLQARSNNVVFAPCWEAESLDVAEKVQRTQVHNQWQNLAMQYKDSNYPDVKLLPLWHGTRPEILKSLFKTGYVNLATTDSGYFGKGLYFAHEAEYSYRVYSKGALIVNWVAMFSAYPVVDGDMDKLTGKANYQNYDAHFVPVVPKDPNNPTEDVYLPCNPNQNHSYIEVVVFEKAQCLPRYLVHLQPTLPKTPGVADDDQNYAPSEVDYSAEAKILKLSTSDVDDYSPIDIDYTTNPQEESYTKKTNITLSLEATPILFKFSSMTFMEESLHALHIKALEGDVKAQNELGKKYYFGNGVPKNYSYAVDLFIKAANQNDPTGQFNLGSCFYNGYGVEQDYRLAVEWYTKAALQGEAEAQNILGNCYKKGKGSFVTKDLEQAIVWFTKAASQNHAAAQYNLGACYQKGEGVTRDYQQAVYWYTKAANQNHHDAQYYLGLCYEKGFGVAVDSDAAIRWYTEAAQNNHAQANQRLKEKFGKNVLSLKN